MNDLFEHVQLAEDEGTMLLGKLLKGDWVVKTTAAHYFYKIDISVFTTLL